MNVFMIIVICLLLFFIHIIGRKPQNIAGHMFRLGLIVVVLYCIQLYGYTINLDFSLNVFVLGVAIVLGVSGILCIILINLIVFL